MKNRKRAIRGMAVWLCVVLSGFHRVPVQAASEEKTYREYLAGEVRTEEASEAENLIQISIRSEADLLELAETVIRTTPVVSLINMLCWIGTFSSRRAPS